MLSFQEFTRKVDEFKNRIMSTNLGIARKDMPQIKEAHVAEFREWLKTDHGVRSRKQSVKVSSLHLTQSEINFDKVLKMMHEAPENVLEKPVIASKNGYILDGHHRIAALSMMNPDKKLTVIEIDLEIRDLLDVAGKFEKVGKRALSEQRNS